jgi:DNA-directed RNA polymerase specialized sigma24 family protein
MDGVKTPVQVVSVETDETGDFAAWVAPHLRTMAHLAARLAPGADRDDVVQEALARAWARRATFDPARGTPRVWLCAIVADQARRARRRVRPAVGPPNLAGEAAAGVDVTPDIDLERAVARLAPRQRLVVDLHYYVGLDVAEAAIVMGCSEGTVKSTLSDARARLRTMLEGP